MGWNWKRIVFYKLKYEETPGNMFFYVGAKKMHIALMMVMMMMMMIVITVFIQSSYMCSSNAMDPDINVNNLNRSLSSFEEIATACMGQYKFRYDSDLQRSFFTQLNSERL